MKKKSIIQPFNFLIFAPLIFYFGKRSYLAYDEGFYALQARWMLEKNNWIIPSWFNEYNLNIDRTIAIQYLIGKSQQFFGSSSFAAHIPTTVFAILMLFMTFKLHEELIDKKGAIFSTLILSTTYIWLNFAHLATQDMIFACLITTGIYSLIKIENSSNKFYQLIFGAWIGLAFMMKTFLVAVPLISLGPYILMKNKTISKKLFCIGFLVGFIPFIFWALLINQYIDRNIIFHLLDKFNHLSNTNNFTNPFYYYLWNIPINFFPWSIFAFIGLFFNWKNKDSNTFILVYFPIILVIILSIFSTKTPYYPLQIASILSINAYTGIKEIFQSKKLEFKFKLIVGKILPIFILSSIAIFYLIYREPINLNLKEEISLITGLIIFSVSWSFLSKELNSKQKFVSLIIGPYLLSSLIVQSGLLTDRSRGIRESMEYIITRENLKDQLINVKTSDINNEKSYSKIIRISIMTPNLGEGVKNLREINSSDYIWATDSKNLNDNAEEFKVIYSDENLYPWKLLIRK